MSKTKEEILKMMQYAKSWREFGLTVKEVYEAFSSDSSGSSDSGVKVHSEVAERASAPVKTPQERESEVIKDLKDKISRLTDTNKQLRAENKALRGGAKK